MNFQQPADYLMRYRVSIQIRAPTSQTILAVVRGLSKQRSVQLVWRLPEQILRRNLTPACIKKQSNYLRSSAADASRFRALGPVQRRLAAPRLDRRYASVVYLRCWSQTVCPDRWAHRTTHTVPPAPIAPCGTPIPAPSNRGWDRGEHAIRSRRCCWLLS